MLIAVAYNTETFRDLQNFLSKNQENLVRQDPGSFDNDFDLSACYINLVINDFAERKYISDQIDARGLKRFSYVHESSVIDGKVESGCFIYPNSTIYHNCQIDKDVIVHSGCHFGHNVSIGKGNFFSGGVIIGGSTKIGNYCKFGLASTIYDGVNIVSDCVFGARIIVRNNVNESGTYGFGKSNKLIKMSSR